MGQGSSRNHRNIAEDRGFHDLGSSTAAIRFHPICGENIQLSRNRSVAKRVESFCKGLVFTHRPIAVNERVVVRFAEYGRAWSGSLRYGFTQNSPDEVSHRSQLAKYACPDMTSKPGSWAKALSENNNSVYEGAILEFWVTQAGDVMYAVNGVEKGMCLAGVNTSKPLWGLFDCYGNAVSIELIDRASMEEAVDSLSHLTLSSRPPAPPPTNNFSSPLHYPRSLLQPLHFHPFSHGSNIRLSNDCCLANRLPTTTSNGYVFTSRSVRPGEKVVVKVVGVDHQQRSSMAFGITSCDPNNVRAASLPDDANQLLDRQEYWVVNKEVVVSPRLDDEIAFLITENGEVQFSRNGGIHTTVMYVDYTQTLWMFFDVYGSTQILSILGSIPALSNSGGEMREISTFGGGTCHASTLTRRSVSEHHNYNHHQHQQTIRSQSAAQLPPVPPPRSSHLSNSLVTLQRVPPDGAPTARASLVSTVSLPVGGGGDSAASECVVCYERQVNCVLYTCGHMSLCYECARVQMSQSGICPMCRAVIQDVIKIFKT